MVRYLMAHGVVRDTPVAIYMESSLDWFIAILGALKAGGAYVPVDPAYPEERVRLILEDCGAPVVVTQERLLKWVPQVQGIASRRLQLHPARHGIRES